MRKPRRNDTRAGANWALEVTPPRGMLFHPQDRPVPLLFSRSLFLSRSASPPPVSFLLPRPLSLFRRGSRGFSGVENAWRTAAPVDARGKRLIGGRRMKRKENDRAKERGRGHAADHIKSYRVHASAEHLCRTPFQSTSHPPPTSAIAAASRPRNSARVPERSCELYPSGPRIGD